MALVVITFAAYCSVLSADFIKFDDDDYVIENQHVLEGLTINGAKWAFSLDDYAGNWHPVTWLSHMLDCELYGAKPHLHHLTNLLIHTANAVILLLVLNAMTGRIWPSAFVAAAFAIHPLHVESVAWIAERKDVLSGLFWILTMACYLGYSRKGGPGRYLLTLVVFALGLMAKPMLVTLPFVLLLLDYWPLERLDLNPQLTRFQTIRLLVMEKIPFFILSAASCVVTYIAQQAGGAVISLKKVPFSDRLSNAGVSYVTYIVKMFWPTNLAPLYPLKDIPLWKLISALLLLAAITIAFLFWLRQKKYFTVGWLWYLGTLIPVIGLVQVGRQSHADRYTYIPLIGLFIITAWSVSDLCRKRPTLRFISIAAATLLTVTMFVFTKSQVAYWKDSFSLFGHTIKVTENNCAMHVNLGDVLDNVGRRDEAAAHYRHALKIDPNNPDNVVAHNNLGIALAENGQLNEAIAHFRRALQIDPDNVLAQKNLNAAMAILDKQN